MMMTKFGDMASLLINRYRKDADDVDKSDEANHDDEAVR
jgi:hypothetical protein